MDARDMTAEILRWFGSDINPDNVSLMSLEVGAPARTCLVVIEHDEGYERRTTCYTKPAST